MSDTRKPVDSVEALERTIANVRAAQKAYAAFTQEQVTKSSSPPPCGQPRTHSLAKLAVAETAWRGGGQGDQNHFASE
jgi:hypothetical protein